ncbi:PREDICTED: putative odorant receptor 85d [Trachymyrmex cornetzi]|uniref:putative odorant receptor 85d n=1 Tax=Trachymyrmex cornetzi TaxID=471704 RepID=UPI00084EEDB9|nr:PREDICTED: putative odorant receptor 85d [Trachymyrmex cornetzi]
MCDDWKKLNSAEEYEIMKKYATNARLITVVRLLYGEINEMLRYLASILAQVIHTFCFSIQGQRLIDHSLQLNDKIYNSSWYEIPAESRKLLLFVMRRNTQPCFLSAGKIYVFSLKSFSTVMQSSVSYFTVLASFQ